MSSNRSTPQDLSAWGLDPNTLVPQGTALVGGSSHGLGPILAVYLPGEPRPFRLYRLETAGNAKRSRLVVFEETARALRVPLDPEGEADLRSAWAFVAWVRKGPTGKWGRVPKSWLRARTGDLVLDLTYLPGWVGK